MARKHTERSYLDLLLTARDRDGQPYLHNLHSEDGLMEKLNEHKLHMHILPKAQNTKPCLSTAAFESLHSGCLSFFTPATFRQSQPQRTPQQISDSGAPSWQRQVSFGKAGPLLAVLAPCSGLPTRDGAKASLKARPEPIEGRSAPAPLVPPRARQTYSFGKTGPYCLQNEPKSCDKAISSVSTLARL